MKFRNGFVSNSSSTAFILDRRKLDASTLQRIRSLPPMDLLNRCTGFTDDALIFLEDRILAIDGWYENGWDCFNLWIQDWIAELGSENVVLCRESDEGMGGEFEDVGLSYHTISKLAESEMEYH
jgi:hypothetical protein